MKRSHSLVLAVALSCWIPTAFAQQSVSTAPLYHAADLIKPPSDFVAPQGSVDRRGLFEPVAMNAERFVLFNYDANQSDVNARRGPLIYRGKGIPVQVLTGPAADGVENIVTAAAISDLAEDGSFWVVAQFRTQDTFVRAVRWHVRADGTAEYQPLLNPEYISDYDDVRFEERDARPRAINSSGTAVGVYKRTSRLRNVVREDAVRWDAAVVRGASLSTPEVELNVAVDVDNVGTFTATGPNGAYRDLERLEIARMVMPLVISSGRIGGYLLPHSTTGTNFHVSQIIPFILEPRANNPVLLPLLVDSSGQPYEIGGEKRVTHMNPNGDALGIAGTPRGGRLDGFVFWKRFPDTNYGVYAMDELLNQTQAQFLVQTDRADVRGIARDGTILIGRVPLSTFVDGALILAPGRDPRPQISSAKRLTVRSGQPFSFQLTATNNPTQFAATTLPPGIQLDATTGLLSGTFAQPGVHSIELKASNGLGVGEIAAYLEIYAIDDSSQPVVTITTPTEGQTFAEGQEINVAASTTSHSQFTVTSFAVTHNAATVTSSGFEKNLSAKLSGLAPGVHVLSGTATNFAGQTGTRSITIRVVPAAGFYTFSGSGDWFDASRWTPQGVPGANDTALIGDSSVVTLSAPVTIRSLSLTGGTINGPRSLTIKRHFSFVSGTLNQVPLEIAQGAELSFDGSAGKKLDGGRFTNRGSVRVGGLAFLDAAGSGLENFGTFSLSNAQARAVFAQVSNDGGVVRLNTGRITVSGGYVQVRGQTSLGFHPINRDLGGIVDGDVTLEGGALTGNGRINGDLRSTGAVVAPGGSPGFIEVSGNYTQGAGGMLLLEVEGFAPAEYDRLTVGGTASLDGRLVVTSRGGVARGEAVEMLKFGAVSGAFAATGSNVQLFQQPTDIDVAISGPNPPAPKALNISTRMRVETGDNALIAGFIVTGDAPKKVLVRGIGPSLPVSGALADPVLSLDNGAVTNDDWKSTQEQAIRDTTIPPSSDLESAIVATLQPGPHTAILRGKNNGTGVGLVEVYDLESGTPVQLANISTRGQVQAGDNVMIGGFIIGGDYPAKVLLRAIGPSLPVSGKLEDPTLELVDANGARIINDNWRATQEAEIIATTVPPTNDNESAIVATLVPGFYTAIVRGKDDTVGVALVEGYNLQ